MKVYENMLYVWGCLIGLTAFLNGGKDQGKLPIEYASPKLFWNQSEEVIPPPEKNSKEFLSQPTTLAFTENKGQFPEGDQVKFLLKTDNVKCYLRKDGLTYSWAKKNASEALTLETKEKEELVNDHALEVEVLQMNWLGANENLTIETKRPIREIKHFYNVKDGEGVVGVRSFQEITYKNVYELIDVVIYILDDELKYDFIVHPGGNVSDIKLAYEGHENMSLSNQGELTVVSSLGEIEEGKPFTYQSVSGKRVPISSHYRLKDGVVQFETESFDPSLPLVIDPTLKWASYYGNQHSEIGFDVYTDSRGNVYMCGVTDDYSFDFATFGTHSTSFYGIEDAFLVKFDPSGNRLWCTYYGGHKEDRGLAVCTDPSNNVFMAGYTHSYYGIAENGHDNTYNVSEDIDGTRFDRDAFLVKFDPDGKRVWGTYYGGEDYDGTHTRAEEGRAVCSDMDGNIFLAGFTSSEQHIAHNGHDNTFGGKKDMLLVKFTNNGTRLWATYYGNEEEDIANSVATDPWGNVYLAGYTESTGLAYYGHDNSYSEDQDGLLVRFDADGNRFWATYYGDQGIDQAHSLAVYGGVVYMAGITSSSKFIAHNGHDNTYNGGMDAFLVKFNFFGWREWGTYYGGANDESFLSWGEYQKTSDVCVSKWGDIYLTGPTRSDTKIATNNGYDPTYNGGEDGFIARFLADGSRQWGSYYGGDRHDRIYGCITDVSADVYIVGRTISESGIAHQGFDNDFDDSTSPVYSDAFIAKFAPYSVGDPNDDGPGDYKDPKKRDFTSDSGLKKGVNMELSEDSGFGTFELYPNPAINQVNISHPQALDQSFQLRMMDMQGRELLNKTIDPESVQTQLDISQYTPGWYLLTLESAESKETRKLIIK